MWHGLPTSSSALGRFCRRFVRARRARRAVNWARLQGLNSLAIKQYVSSSVMPSGRFRRTTWWLSLLGFSQMDHEDLETDHDSVYWSCTPLALAEGSTDTKVYLTSTSCYADLLHSHTSCMSGCVDLLVKRCEKKTTNISEHLYIPVLAASCYIDRVLPYCPH